MSYHRNTLLAGIATLALVAGAGLASAQESSTPQSKQPHATQQMNQAPAGKMGQSAQDQNRGSAAHQPSQRAEQTNRANKDKRHKAGAKAERDETKAGKNAQDKSGDETKAGKNAQDKNAQERDRTRRDRHDTAQDRDRMKGQNAEGDRNGKAAQEQNRNGRESNTAAQRQRNGLEGLQGNASGMHAQLTDEQRTRIRSTVINATGAPRVGRVDFDVQVGTVIPRGRIHVIPVPETLVQIEPEWRGFLYFVYEDEVVIVNPSDMRIIAVVPV